MINEFFLFISLKHRLVMYKGINNAPDHLNEPFFAHSCSYSLGVYSCVFDPICQLEVPRVAVIVEPSQL